KAQQLSRSQGPEQTAAINQEINRLEEEFQQTQAAIRRASPRYTALERPQPLTLPEMQRQLDDDTLLLEYSLGQKRSHLWAISKDALGSYELPGRGRIEKASREVYDLMTARGRPVRGETPQRRRARLARTDAQLREAAGRLSRTLVGPAAANLGTKRLVIVA